MTETEIRKLEQKLLRARSRMMLDNPFFAQLLMHVKLEIVPEFNYTAGTNGRTIIFDERFLDKITESELQTVLMHELMHILFRHMDRRGTKSPLVYNIAGDIVINDLILEAKGENIDAITLGFANNEVLMHELPKKVAEERNLEPGGRHYTANQVYDILTEEVEKIKQQKQHKQDTGKHKPGQGEDSDGEPDEESDGSDETGKGTGKNSKPDVRSKNGGSADEGNSDGDEDEDEDQNGNAGSGGNQHTHPSAVTDNATKEALKDLFDGQDPEDAVKGDHSRWGEEEPDDVEEEFQNAEEQWRVWVKQAAETAQQRQDRGIGFAPCLAQRLIGNYFRPKINWREILHDFIAVDVCDYTLNPPDNRYSDSGYFLPAFKVPREVVKNICFYVDGSGSMDDDELTEAYSEIKGCVDQFDNVQGYIGCFDAAATDPMPFEDFEGFEKLTQNIYGGGGTDVVPAFEKIAAMDEPPEFIVIITDGYLKYPSPEIARGVPVLWLLTMPDAEPTWGQVAYLHDDK